MQDPQSLHIVTGRPAASRLYLSSEAGTLRGAPCSFQSGKSSCSARGSSTLPDSMCAPVRHPMTSSLQAQDASRAAWNRHMRKSRMTLNRSTREVSTPTSAPFSTMQTLRSLSASWHFCTTSEYREMPFKLQIGFRSAGNTSVPACGMQWCYMPGSVRLLRQGPTCLSLMAADRPAGPAPTMQTSYSMVSRGSTLSACADMLRDAGNPCMATQQGLE